MSDVSANFINPEGMHRPTGYTHVVEVTAGRPVYISGQVALDGAGELVGPGDVAAQVVDPHHERPGRGVPDHRERRRIRHDPLELVQVQAHGVGDDGGDGRLPGAADHLADPPHRLRVGGHHADRTQIVQHVLRSDGLGPDT